MTTAETIIKKPARTGQRVKIKVQGFDFTGFYQNNWFWKKFDGNTSEVWLRQLGFEPFGKHGWRFLWCDIDEWEDAGYISSREAANG